MKRNIIIAVLVIALSAVAVRAENSREYERTFFPDGTAVSAWFGDTVKVDVDKLGPKYLVTEYGVKEDSTIVQTDELQKVIDRVAESGGGVVVIPRGVFLSGSLFFKKGTHLHIEEGGVLKGVDAIKHYKIIKTHFEGQWIDYFAALVNADCVDGFTITGQGTINGDALRFWEEFWIRRKVNPKCTNLEAMRPRLVYISNSDDVTLQDVNIVNSAFWSTHLYRCNRVKYLDCRICAPTSGDVKAPSSDGIDIDVCRDVLVRGCYINVCDDAVCLKGGRGTYVDSDTTAGSNSNVIVEKCVFGSNSNGGITFGSDSWNDRNIIMRDCRFERPWHVLLFKMRPDTPQTYEYVRVENCTGSCRNAIEVSTWTQFHTLLERADMPVSRVANIEVKNLDVKCSNRFLFIKRKHNFEMSDFTFENIRAEAVDDGFDTSAIDGCVVKDVKVSKLDSQSNFH